MLGFWIFQDCQYVIVLNFQFYLGFTCFYKYYSALPHLLLKSLMENSIFCAVYMQALSYWDQVSSSKKILKFWNGPHCRMNQTPLPHSMLQHIGRVATPKLVPRYFLRYLGHAHIISYRFLFCFTKLYGMMWTHFSFNIYVEYEFKKFDGKNNEKECRKY